MSPKLTPMVRLQTAPTGKGVSCQHRQEKIAKNENRMALGENLCMTSKWRVSTGRWRKMKFEPS